MKRRALAALLLLACLAACATPPCDPVAPPVDGGIGGTGICSGALPH